MKNKRRFFAFGCSYTHFGWPTWADIIGKQYGENFYNCGRYGVGNMYIHSAIMEADQVYKFSKNDLIIVCWTSCFRQDYYKENQWIRNGNIANWPSKYIDRYFDMRGFLIRDLALIKSVYEFLENKKCEYQMLSAFPISPSENWERDAMVKKIDMYPDVSERYRDIISKVFPCYAEVIEHPHRPIPTKHGAIEDAHPTPAEHLEYITKTIPQYLPEDCSFVDQYTKILFEQYHEDAKWSTDWDVYYQRKELQRL